jgi:hypothetical protein
MMRDTILLLGLLAFSFGASPADASVSVALTLDDVARSSELVARVVPIEQTSAWEDGRIVSTTRLKLDRSIAGSSSASEVRVRTLGGQVGNIGQIVEGEARFAPATPSIVFLARYKDSFVVSGRAQGQFLVNRKDAREIVRVLSPGMLVDRQRKVPLAPSSGPLLATFDGRDAGEVTREAALAWERTHAH